MAIFVKIPGVADGEGSHVDDVNYFPDGLPTDPYDSFDFKTDDVMQSDVDGIANQNPQNMSEGIIDIGDLPMGIIDVGDLPMGIIDIGDLPMGIIDIGDLPDGIIDVGDLPDGFEMDMKYMVDGYDMFA